MNTPSQYLGKFSVSVSRLLSVADPGFPLGGDENSPERSTHKNRNSSLVAKMQLIGKASDDSLFATSHFIKYEINDYTFILFFDLVALALILVDRQTMQIDFAHMYITSKRSLSFRFTKERKGNRHPMAYMPFGGGPRNCIGMRFAIMEAKMEVINMLKRFTILKCTETQVPLKCTRDGIHGPAEGVYVKLIKRE